jgi:flagellar hook-length control protein FliK
MNSATAFATASPLGGFAVAPLPLMPPVLPQGDFSQAVAQAVAVPNDAVLASMPANTAPASMAPASTDTPGVSETPAPQVPLTETANQDVPAQGAAPQTAAQASAGTHARAANTDQEAAVAASVGATKHKARSATYQNGAPPNTTASNPAALVVTAPVGAAVQALPHSNGALAKGTAIAGTVAAAAGHQVARAPGADPAGRPLATAEMAAKPQVATGGQREAAASSAAPASEGQPPARTIDDRAPLLTAATPAGTKTVPVALVTVSKPSAPSAAAGAALTEAGQPSALTTGASGIAPAGRHPVSLAPASLPEAPAHRARAVSPSNPAPIVTAAAITLASAASTSVTAPPAIGAATSAPSASPAAPSLPAGTASEPGFVNTAAALAATVTAMVKDGKSSVSMRLDPADLGSVSIHLAVGQDAKVNVLMLAAVPQTAQAFSAGADDLRQAFAAAGLALGHLDIGGGGTAGGAGTGQQSSGRVAHKTPADGKPAGQLNAADSNAANAGVRAIA